MTSINPVKYSYILNGQYSLMKSMHYLVGRVAFRGQINKTFD
jgi:hypothetical protein